MNEKFRKSNNLLHYSYDLLIGNELELILMNLFQCRKQTIFFSNWLDTAMTLCFVQNKYEIYNQRVDCISIFLNYGYFKKRLTSDTLYIYTHDNALEKYRQRCIVFIKSKKCEIWWMRQAPRSGVQF